MTVDLEQRLSGLGAWLDLAAPEVDLAEVTGPMVRADRPEGVVADASPATDLGDDPARLPVGPVSSAGGRHRLLAVAAAAVLLVTAGLVAATRRPGPAGTENPVAPDPGAPTVTADAGATTVGTAVAVVPVAGAFAELVTPALPSGFTAVATARSSGPVVVALDGYGRTLVVSFVPGGADQARREWSGAAGVDLVDGVPAGSGSSAVVVSSAGDAVAASCTFGDDDCDATALDPPVDVRTVVAAVAAAVSGADRGVFDRDPATLTAAATGDSSSAFARFAAGLGVGFEPSTSGALVPIRSWRATSGADQRVSLQIVPSASALAPVLIDRVDLVSLTVVRDGRIVTAVSRSLSAAVPVTIDAPALRRLVDDALAAPSAAATDASCRLADATGTIACTTGTVPAASVAAVASASVPPPPPLVAALTLTAQELALAQDALQRSQATCMAAAGHTFTTSPYDSVWFGMGSLDEWFGDRLTVASAAVRGYQQEVPPYDVAAEQRYQRAMDENTARGRADAAYERALERCSLAAQDAVFGAGDESFGALQASTADALRPVLRPAADTPAYAAAVAAWRRCAQAVGITDGSPRPRTPFGQAVGAPPTTAPNEAERARAVADATCRAQAGMQAALRAEAERLLDRWLAAHPGIVERLSTLRAALLERARAILAGS